MSAANEKLIIQDAEAIHRRATREMLKWGKPLYVYLTPHGDIKRTREGQPQQEKFDMDPKMRLMGVYDERASFDWILEDLRYMYGM